MHTVSLSPAKASTHDGRHQQHHGCILQSPISSNSNREIARK